MRRITESEKQRIIGLHESTPMKPFLFEQPVTELPPPDMSKMYPAQSSTYVAPSYKGTEKILQSFDEKDFIGKNDVRNFDGFLSTKFYNFLNVNFPSVVEKYGLSNNTLMNRDFISLVKKENSKNNYGILKNIGDVWNEQTIYQKKIYQDWKNELLKKNFEPPKWVENKISEKLTFITKQGSPIPQGNLSSDYKLTPEEESQQKHNRLLILSVAAALIPFVGLPLSTLISVVDAEMYVNEGKYEEAALAYLFALLPGIALFQKIPFVKKYGKEGLINLAHKLNKQKIKLSKEEMEAIDELSKVIESKGGKQAIDNWISSQANYNLQQGAKKSVMTAETYKKLNQLVQVGLYGTPIYYYEPISQSIGQILYGKSLEKFMGDMGLPIQLYREQFGSDGSKEDDEKLYKALKDNKSTSCGPWRINRPVPPMYQTTTYKRNLSKKVESLEEVGIISPNEDCRKEGTFAKPIKGVGQDTYEYKFSNGKYYTRRKGNTDWIDVTNNQSAKNAIEKLFTNKGLKKDERGLFYVE